MGKGICHIYKYCQRNWLYPDLNTIFVPLERSEPYIQTQSTSASDASMGEHDLASSISDQSTIHHGNTNVNDNSGSHSFETNKKNNISSYCFGDTINTTAT